MATVEPLAFSDWLSQQLAARNWGVRTLARKINPADPEPPRRTLNRYLHEGKQPTPLFREAIAEAFGIALADVPAEEAAPSGVRFRDGGGHVRGAGGAAGGGEPREGGTDVKDAA